MVLSRQSSLPKRLRILATFLHAYIFIGGLTSFIGWVADIPRLTDWPNTGISIQPNAAIAVVSAGAGLILLTLGYRRAAAVLGGFTALLGASVLVEYATGIDFGVDGLLTFGRTWGRVGVLAPGRMGPPGATSWTLIGIALMLSSRAPNSRGRMAAPVLGLSTAGLSSLSLIGYLYGAGSLYTIPTLTIIALQTATFIFAVSVSIVLSAPECGVMRLMLENSPAGILARRILPALICIPILLGFFRVMGDRATLFDPSFGSALRTVAEIVLFLILLYSTGIAINRQAQGRREADEALRSSQQRLIETLDRERAAREDAERAVRLKDEFLATLSHELRTPLNAILGWSYFLKKDIRDPEKARKAAEVIERNGRLQAQLITDLLDMSRILSGKLRLDVQRVELPLVIDAAIESILPAAHAKGVRIDRNVDPISDAIDGDPGRLQQVVWNLLSNAVKFTPRGGRVGVELVRTNSHVSIRIGDTGEGIAPEFLPHIFDRFRQADSSASREHGGLGLGLAIVKQLVELHGGGVRADSEGKGKGSTFVIELPIAIPREEESVYARFQRPPDRRISEQLAILRGIKILVVDDEPDALAMVRRALEESGGVVRSASSSEDAIQLLEWETFDVIVSDIAMPFRDGYAFLTELRKRGIQTPALALTAFARTEDRTKSLSSGYQAHLSKPVDISELTSTVASLADRPNAAPDRVNLLP